VYKRQRGLGDVYKRQVKACAMGGASGFLAGRAVWADIVGAADIPKALREVSIPRLEQLAEIVDTHAKPWTSW
jgi:sulfofructosephosphate aldolase